MQMKILVTGGTGFVGSHLLDRLTELRDKEGKKIEIFATRRYHLSRRDKVEHLENLVEWIDCDITDSVGVNNLIKYVKPDQCFNLASESFVSPSWSHPHRFMDVNYHGTVNLLESIKTYSPGCIYLNPGSGEEYGEVSIEDLPINKTTELKPVNPYAVTKVAQDLICFVYHRSYNLNTIRLRTFNHEGPRRERYFGIASYAYQIAKIKQGLQEKIIRVGHIDDKRNFTHVKDIVEAYLVAVKKAVPGKLYVVGSENENNVATFREILNTLIQKSNLNGIEVKEVAEFVRPTNVPYLIGDTSEFRNETGWTPKIGLNEMLDSIQSYWDDRVSKHPNM
jgi:GDP-4-dehydro-6-deoxy-D-mannose reductase